MGGTLINAQKYRELNIKMSPEKIEPQYTKLKTI